MAGFFGLVWVFGGRIRKAALSECPVDTRNRRGFSAEKRIRSPLAVVFPDNVGKIQVQTIQYIQVYTSAVNLPFFFNLALDKSHFCAII